MHYPGGKNCAGTYQTIINQIPPHAVFIELFAGSAAITRHKRPAAETILVDRDPEALEMLRGHCPPGTSLDNADALEVLRALIYREERTLSANTFIYADPPYMHARCRYRYEFNAVGHAELLKLLNLCPCMVMISGYRSSLYNDLVGDWRRLDYSQITRGGVKAIESLWMNYPRPAILHDPRYAGGDYRQRENLARKSAAGRPASRPCRRKSGKPCWRSSPPNSTGRNARLSCVTWSYRRSRR